MRNLAVTFDFHNTLASCPEWFDLEVKHLPSSFLRWRSKQGGETLSPEVATQADTRYRQLRREIIEHGNELTAEACLEEVFGSMQIRAASAEIAVGVESLMRELLSRATPIAGSVETVLALRSHGVSIGVVSSAVYHPFLEWTLAKFGISDALRAIVTSASAGFYKSRPELYLHAAELIGADPARVVHVGDSLRFDVGGASRAGMATVWLRHDDVGDGHHEITPDLTLRTLRGSAPEILELLATRADGSLSSDVRSDV